MANENKKNVSEVEIEETVVPTETVATPVQEEVEDISGEIITDIKVERETFDLGEGDEKRQCYDYFVRCCFLMSDGSVREIKSHLGPRDFGGYDVLDLLYNMFGESLQFRLCPWTIKAEKKGEKDSSGVFYVIASPLAPEKMRLKVKSVKDSDKSVLEMYLYLKGYHQ